jgi:translation initiation factor IF-3
VYNGVRRIPNISKYYLINDRIREKELRVLTGEGENLGVMATQEALSAARQRGQDLVLIAPEAKPPVAKILDFNKFLYQENKKRAASKAKSKKSELKEVRIGPSTGDGDVQRWLDRAVEWINEGNRVKVSVSMRGRENLYPNLAFDKINKFKEGLAETAKPEGEARQMGNIISIVFVTK